MNGPKRIDFLLPHASSDSPPAPGASDTPYDDWPPATYGRSMSGGRPMSIRLFDSLMSTARGGPGLSEWVGTDAAYLAVIETDGTFEQADTLKKSYAGAAATGMSVRTHSVSRGPESVRSRIDPLPGSTDRI